MAGNFNQTGCDCCKGSCPPIDPPGYTELSDRTYFGPGNYTVAGNRCDYGDDPGDPDRSGKDFTFDAPVGGWYVQAVWTSSVCPEAGEIIVQYRDCDGICQLASAYPGYGGFEPATFGISKNGEVACP